MKKSLFNILLSIVLVLGLMPGASFKAQAADLVRIKSQVSRDAKSFSVTRLEVNYWIPKEIKITDVSGWKLNGSEAALTSDYTTQSGLLVTAYDKNNKKITAIPYEAIEQITLNGEDSLRKEVEDQEVIKLEAAISPEGATQKYVDWVTNGTEKEGLPKLYLDEGCTKPVELNTPTQTLTVYAKIDGTPKNYPDIRVYPAEFHSHPARCTFIAKEQAEVTTKPTAIENMTENGTAQNLVNEGKASGGTIQYALGSDATIVPTKGWSTAIPAGTNAGTYYVWYKAVGDDSHADSEPACVTVTIEKSSGEEIKNPDGSRTVTEVKENKDGTANITVTNYSSKDEQISQYVFKQTKGTKVDLKNVNGKNLKTVVVPGAVKANGKTYKVTRISKGFLKNCKQATKVDIGKNINIIDENAFNYGKKVKTVIIRGKLKKVGKGAFKKTKKNVIIKVKTGAKNFEKNKTLLEKSGLPKNATVKRVKNKK